jgi:hypothetical protein
MWNGFSTGRVCDVRSVTVVPGRIGDLVVPISARKGSEGFVFGDQDVAREDDGIQQNIISFIINTNVKFLPRFVSAPWGILGLHFGAIFFREKHVQN